jgi:c-di-GMP-binding flagellar brake protein YcgR
MALFGFGEKKSDGAGLVQVLAYLEDALRLRSPFALKLSGKPEVQAALHSLSEDARTFRLLPERPFQAAKGTKVSFTLIHEGMRLGATTRLAEAREGIVVLHFPEALELMERRRHPRARLNPKEGASLTALQDIFEGVGINCTLENVSEGGARVRVDKAITISTEKRLVLGTNLVPPGQTFLMIKLNKIPKCPATLEAKGKAVYLSHGGEGLMMGLAFDKLAADVEGVLARLVGSRSKPIPHSLPIKARRVKETREEPEPAPIPAPADPEPPLVQAPESEPMPVLAPEADPVAVDRRLQLRLSLGPGFLAGFMVDGDPVTGAAMLDVSTGGCCLRMAPEHCRGLASGTMLEQFHFQHRHLPNGFLDARVSWVLGKNAHERGGPMEGRYCLVGIEFCEPAPELVEGLEAYIAWHFDFGGDSGQA